ncbi:MAG: glycosyl hydrolase family 28-related protein [Victivallales bacterium]|jgi:hypothetical protein
MVNKKRNASCPVVFWHSDPVMPDETVVLAGANFSALTMVDLALVGEGREERWTEVVPSQWSEISLKALVPSDWPKGVYACRARDGEKVSKTVLVNAPDVWWKQGDEGVDRARQGGWLRILGKCLDLDGKSSVSLQAESDSRKVVALKMEDTSCFSLKAKIPSGLTPGKYRVMVSNGKGGKKGVRDAGILEAMPVKEAPKAVISVIDLGADPTGMKDCTLSIVQVIERLSMIGGGVVYFPRGRYRIDAILRSGTWIKSPLFIPENITLRGEGPDLVSLWWPDQEKALPTLIDGRNDFGVEDLSIFTQGYHSTIITGSSNVRIRNVRIRANYFYMTNNNGGAHHERAITPPGSAKVGPAILLWGENNQVTGCDILHLACAFDLRFGRGSIIADNTIRAANMHALNGTCEMIFENNENTGNSMSSGGNNIGLHMGASVARHVYYANNRSCHLYGGDHEAFTLDGHATAYLGKVREVNAKNFVLDGKTFLGDKAKGGMKDMYSTAAYIIDGRGAGQYRWLTHYEGNRITVDREWDMPPDESSIVSIGGFNGRHLFIGNTATDTGTLIQLYPPNCECILSGNRSIRASNINSLGKLGKIKDSGFVRVEPSWYNQFLDNHVVIGNTWGGGSTQIDRWIGGECTLNIWGWEVYYCTVDGADLDMFLTPEVLKQMIAESKLRTRSIPISRFQIVRRHRVDNNSSIRIHGAVADVLIEGCNLNLSRKGIRVDMEMNYNQPLDIGQLFDFDPEPSATNQPIPFLTPEGVLIRKNKFNEVQIPYSGTALEYAKVEL